MKIDVLIEHGTVIDPSTGHSGKYDVAITGDRIVGILEPGTVGGDIQRRVNAEGCLVTPGLIDIHAHIFEAVPQMGVKPDNFGVDQGVTTIADAGSSGEQNFHDFVERSVKQNATEVLAWLNISSPGLVEGRSELADLNRLVVESTLARIAEYPETIIGIKARMSGSVVKGSGISPLAVAKSVARRAELPVMVHIGNAPPKLQDVLDLMEEGDVLTHAFHGKPGGILDEHGQLIPQAQRALDRGVRFDVGHGSASFSFATMNRARELGITPYSISTDLYLVNWLNGPVYSLTTTMTKFLALGYSIDQIIEWTTAAPARILRKSDDIGTLKVGTIADISILKIVDQPVELIDSENEKLSYNKLIQAQYTMKSGELYTCK
ncbi:amidohydrolase/deacetylase family metallohydrolase [Paenibacillus albiflavus]|uniref:Amidohydrolase/deacetylase family metallohydrolase n=1 Tax=Paenibacillus albiflavus TaxID=2545760 RepID=A0A4R4ENL1_9BACL|nr:amidohydrolase/deacetylase family metallohydrolase [Paenibacillus albiflavus]TCZ81030.1 amidohydrolase/deacetylase family metallohydrolase [Paenibacillus albiflavus]